jgi:glycosyltransferase involved in cell wall biosynthesis
MKILVLAPQPFYQERGTPIAVKLLLEVLAERYTAAKQPNGNTTTSDPRTSDPRTSEIHILTYHEGTDISLPGVTQHRIKFRRWIQNIRPGISLKKLIADWFFFWKSLHLVWKNRHAQFQLIHAIEESVFIAWVIKQTFRIPYVYDMDSSLSDQLTDRWRPLKAVLPVLEYVESIAIRGSLIVIPVCNALADSALAKGAKRVSLLTDIAVIDENSTKQPLELHEELAITSKSELVIYVGNLQPYQGVELLVDSFLEIASEHPSTYLVIIGGTKEDCLKLSKRIPSTEEGARIKLVGHRPFDLIGSYLAHADVLASPRLEGNNTPMKIYNYLASGKAILATNITSHTQVLTKEVAFLCEPTLTGMAEALNELLKNKDIQVRLGKQGAALARNKYTKETFRLTVLDIYASIESSL